VLCEVCVCVVCVRYVCVGCVCVSVCRSVGVFVILWENANITPDILRLFSLLIVVCVCVCVVCAFVVVVCVCVCVCVLTQITYLRTYYMVRCYDFIGCRLSLL